MSISSNIQIAPMDSPAQCSNNSNDVPKDEDIEAQVPPLKKKRTVTFAEMDPSQLDVNGQQLYTIIPPAKYDDTDSEEDEHHHYHRMILLVKFGIIGFFILVCILIFFIIVGNSASTSSSGGR